MTFLELSDLVVGYGGNAVCAPVSLTLAAGVAHEVLHDVGVVNVPPAASLGRGLAWWTCHARATGSEAPASCFRVPGRHAARSWTRLGAEVRLDEHTPAPG